MTRRALTIALAGVLLFAVRRADLYGPPATPGLEGSAYDPQIPAGLARTIDPVIDTLWSSFDRRTALEHVRVASQFWRLTGNAGYDATLDRVRSRLADSGFPATALRVETYPNTGHGWDYSLGTLAIVRSGQPDEVVLSKETHQLALCINSFSTSAGGIVVPVVDVGRGDRDQDFAGKTLKGAVLLGDADAGTLWRRAVANEAVGVISTSLGAYIRPTPPGVDEPVRESWDILQWSSIPYDAARRGFGFKATPRAAARLRQLITRGGPRPLVRVNITSTFTTAPARTLVAEIPGRVVPAERIVIAAHVQEPGANDNASGVATLAELARALQDGIQRGKIPPPARTITFLWLDEISGSRQWLKDHPEAVKDVRYMFSMDMTGEDVKKTGGTFLIERWPDPGAVWERPWDPHSEWGRGNVRADQVKGDLINDLHRSICERVAAKTGWVVKTNPYEGGSDHTVFGTAGIPAVLNWHFTDRYYHSNFDTVDKTSPDEMRNVGVAVGASAWLMASANEAAALAVGDLVAEAGRARLATEEREGVKLANADANPQILRAWKKWYAEAVRSVNRLVIGPASATLQSRLTALASTFE
jgi:aminopeptidase YwaD